MQHYELLSIVQNDVTDADLEGVSQQIRELVAKSGGTITKEESLGRRRFAYPINKQTQGTYVLYGLDLDGEALQQINRELQLAPEILRHQIVEARVRSEKELAREAAIREKIQNKRQEARQREESETRKEELKKEEAKPMKKEELEKKLDTILEDDMLKEA